MRAVLLVILLLAPAAAAAAAAAPADWPADASTSPVWPRVVDPALGLVSVDPDGGRTLRLLIEDGEGGSYSYTRVDLSESHETAGGVLALLSADLGRDVAAEPEPVREAGAYAHAWSWRGSPMTTVGVYAVHATEGLLRAPLVVFENVTGTDPLVADATALLVDEAVDFSVSAVPFLTEYAAAELGNGFDEWPPNAASVDSFRDRPRVYAWTVRKASPAGDAWVGAYLDRLGHASGGFAPEEPFAGAKSFEVGAALRVDGATAASAGLFAETTLEKRAGATRAATQRYTVGVASPAAGGRVPLAGVELTDARTGPGADVYPAAQRDGITLGAYVGGKWTPLVGTATESTHALGEGDDVAQTRTTSVGAFVAGRYVPLAGVRYEGERSPALAWASRFVTGGTLGDADAGGFRLDAGAFADGRLVPLAGASVEDAFPHQRHARATLVTAGAHAPGGYAPLVAASYDGELHVLEWALAWSGGDRSRASSWMTAAGTFADGRYAPLVGARHEDRAPGGARAHQEQFAAGVFLADYRAFVPLAGAAWDGDASTAAWARALADGGGPGAAAGAWHASAGAFALGAYRPLVSARFADAAPNGRGAELVVGAHGPPGIAPAVGAEYASDAPLLPGLGDPADPDDDVPSEVRLVARAGDARVALASLHHDPERTVVTVLPTP